MLQITSHKAEFTIKDLAAESRVHRPDISAIELLLLWLKGHISRETGYTTSANKTEER